MTNKSDRAERAALAGSTGTMTYHSRAAVEQTLETGGRFADKVSLVVGETPAVQYPRLPAGSPWAGDPVGLEPPLGFSVDAMEPTGEAHEIQASLATGSPVPVASGAEEGAPLASSAPDPHAQLAELLPKIAMKKWI